MRDSTARAHLRQLGLHPATINRLHEYAAVDGQSLQELVAYILRDYAPPAEPEPDEAAQES